MACKGWLARYEQGLKQTKGNKTFNLRVGAITRLYLVVLINCLTRGIAQVAGGFQRMIGTLFHTGNSHSLMPSVLVPCEDGSSTPLSLRRVLVILGRCDDLLIA